MLIVPAKTKIMVVNISQKAHQLGVDFFLELYFVDKSWSVFKELLMLNKHLRMTNHGMETIKR